MVKLYLYPLNTQTWISAMHHEFTCPKLSSWLLFKPALPSLSHLHHILSSQWFMKNCGMNLDSSSHIQLVSQFCQHKFKMYPEYDHFSPSPLLPPGRIYHILLPSCSNRPAKLPAALPLQSLSTRSQSDSAKLLVQSCLSSATLLTSGPSRSGQDAPWSKHKFWLYTLFPESPFPHSCNSGHGWHLAFLLSLSNTSHLFTCKPFPPGSLPDISLP